MGSSVTVASKKYYVLGIDRCNFILNWANSGGALTTIGFSNNIQINNSDFVGNFALNEGGAIKFTSNAKQSKVYIQNCVFMHNFAQSGGGVYDEFGLGSQISHSIAFNSFINNSASKRGGAFFAVKSERLFQR